MLVETFECSEVQAEDAATCEEALSIIEKLGLTGQKELTAKKEDGDVRCPYRQITHEENFVYRTICPEATKLDKYKASPIPLRVLQVAAHAKSLNMFDHLMVWDRVSVVDKDPVLVGYVGQYDFSPREVFILARWGEELETFSILLKRAVVIARERLIEQATKCDADIRTASDSQIIKWGARATISAPS